jgi:hypothetical protein
LWKPNRPIAPVKALHERAADDLRFIRAAMEGSGRFTAVPGRGTVAMGAIALAAAWYAGQARSVRDWLVVWAAALTLALAVGLVALHRKAARLGTPTLSGPGRRFLLGLCPAIVVGALVTLPLVRMGQHRMIPAIWLLTYGAGVVAAGSLSVAVVPLTGAAIMALGGVALWFPQHGNALLAAGFGAAHIVAGFYVARRHGG